MKILIEIILVTITIFIIFVFYFKLKNNQKNANIKDKNDALVINDKNYFPIIQIVSNEDIIPMENNKILDKDVKKALATIDNVLPKSTIIANNIKNGTELLNKKRTFFSATKKGTENMLSVGRTNKVYGTQMIKDKTTNRKLFDKNTEFTREDSLIKATGKNALVNAGFNVASIAVGQYYMSEINSELEDIKKDINEISNYLDTEYQGKMMHIIAKLKEVVENKSEILNNNFLIDKRYNEIIDLETECTKLLGQADMEIEKNILNEVIDYKNYEEKLTTISKWLGRQQILQRLLLEIGDLRYALAGGNETSKFTHTQYNIFLEKTNLIIEKLEKMHLYMNERLGIDIKAARMNGKFYKIRKNTIGKINEDWAYRKIDENIVRMIENQTKVKKMVPYTGKKQEDVIKIQKYNGEYYKLDK